MDPNHPEAAYIPTHQILVNKVLAFDQDLTAGEKAEKREQTKTQQKNPEDSFLTKIHEYSLLNSDHSAAEKLKDQPGGIKHQTQFYPVGEPSEIFNNNGHEQAEISPVADTENFSAISSSSQSSKLEKVKCRFYTCPNFLTEEEKFYCSQCYRKQKSSIAKYGLEQALNLRTSTDKFLIETGALNSPLAIANETQSTDHFTPASLPIEPTITPNPTPIFTTSTRDKKAAKQNEKFQTSRQHQLDRQNQPKPIPNNPPPLPETNEPKPNENFSPNFKENHRENSDENNELNDTPSDDNNENNTLDEPSKQENNSPPNNEQEFNNNDDSGNNENEEKKKLTESEAEEEGGNGENTEKNDS
ncbi:26850_t:CDS:1 [Racocetra persica]|uniref:26850_t:CDS:1 n=1 Tax=Racocetra persica TaxID=160502 RepID=A0ACA9R1X3_9GLOM|nr:26850_t:CDS:1 [Racocetra persica]